MQTIPIQKSTVQIRRVNEFIRSVYNWMALGLGLTGLIAFFISNDQALMHLILGNQLLFFGLIIGELILVFSISARIQNMRASTATSLFLLYAALTVLRFHLFSYSIPKPPLHLFFLSVLQPLLPAVSMAGLLIAI